MLNVNRITKPGRTILNFHDTCRAEIAHDDGGWDFTFPSGVHQRGKAVDVEAAESAVYDLHEKWVLTMWAKGAVNSRGQWVAPLR